MGIIQQVGRAALASVGRVALKGIGAVTSDASVWTNPALWGAGATHRKKQYFSKTEMLESFASWVYICVKLNAQSVASVPLSLYVEKRSKAEKFTTISTKAVARMDKMRLARRRGAVGRRVKAAPDVEEVTSHVLLDMMARVNPMQNWSDLIELTVTYLDLTGEAYWWIRRSVVGAPAELWVVPSQYMTGKTDPNKVEFTVDGYEYRRGALAVVFKPEEIIPFSYPNPKNIFQGLSILNGVADAVYTNEKMYEFEESVFENKARVGGIVTSEENYSEETLARLKEQWKQTYQGAARAGKTLFLPKGLKFTPDAQTMQELAYIDGKKITREEICAAFDVPIAALVATDVNRANAETADYRHAKNGVLPRCTKIEEKVNERLIPLFDERLFVAFEDPVPEDKEYRLREREAHIDKNIETINEIRTELGKEPVPWGDTGWFQTTLQPFAEDMLDGGAEADDDEGEAPVPPGKPPADGDEGEPEKPEKPDEEAAAFEAEVKREMRRLLGA